MTERSRFQKSPKLRSPDLRTCGVQWHAIQRPLSTNHEHTRFRHFFLVVWLYTVCCSLTTDSHYCSQNMARVFFKRDLGILGCGDGPCRWQDSLLCHATFRTDICRSSIESVRESRTSVYDGVSGDPTWYLKIAEIGGKQYRMWFAVQT